jgi:D-alanyl-D-alanine carboxypeptidase (penicillin-binding protein 5/6)
MGVDEPREIDRAKVARFGGYVIGIVVVVLVVVAGVRWFRPIPAPVFRSAVSTSIRLPGTLPSLPWPVGGAAALSVDGAGSLGHTGSTRPAPIAGLAKVMTAYVVLEDHPLAPGASGPAIPVTAVTMAAAQTETASQQSVVPVTVGETFTELQALEGLLVAQGNDMATLLTDWDTGSTAAFVAKMNAAAHRLGLSDSTFTDPSGLDPGTMSTPADMVRLGAAAMAIPAFAQVVAMPQVTLPLAGVIYNFDYDLGHDGIVGIKTGSDAAAGGCFLFAAQRTVGAETLTLVGTVFGQGGFSPITTALDDAETLVNAAFAATREFPALRAGHLAGRVVAPWGPSVPVTASTSTGIVGWSGLTVATQMHVGALPTAIPVGARIGVLSVDLGSPGIDLALQTSRPLNGPSAFWRITRL